MSRKMFPLLAVWVLFILISTPLALAKVQPAGHVISAGEGVKAEEANGAVRDLKRHSEVYEGDTIITGESSVQIRFSDGGLTALRPRTSFKIETYRWEGKEDGSEKGFFSLIKGGLRTISGAIGKKYQDNYKMKTQVATIGIRGTDYFLEWLEDSGLTGGVIKGKIYVWNEAGGYLFSAGEKFIVKSGGDKPQIFINNEQGGSDENGFVPPIHSEQLLQPEYSTEPLPTRSQGSEVVLPHSLINR